jgi:hypothetical protein
MRVRLSGTGSRPSAAGFRAAVLATALLAVSVVFGSCSGKNDDKGNDTGSKQPDPQQLLVDAASKMENVKSFHFLLEHENGASKIVLGLKMQRAEGDIAKPDRVKADVDATASQLGNAKVSVTVISVGSKAQVTNPFNKRQWVDIPGENPLADLFDPGVGTTTVIRAVKNPRITGEETINGKDVWKVEGDVDAGQLRSFTSSAEQGYTVKGTAWVGKSDHLVYRIRLEGPVGPDDDKNIVRKIELSHSTNR